MPTINVPLDESQLNRSLSNLKRELKFLSTQARVYKWQLIAINTILEGIVRKKRKYTRKSVESKPVISQFKCSKCSGTGMINQDKAGIFARYCDCEVGQRKLAEKKRIFDK